MPIRHFMNHIFRACAYWLLPLTLALSACANAATTEGAHIQWSEPTKLYSPNGVWKIETHPVLKSDENETPVTLSRGGSSVESQLFILSRAADVYWGPDRDRLLVINQPVANSYELNLFDLKRIEKGNDLKYDDRLDRKIKKDLGKQMQQGQSIVFFLPSFVAWESDNLVLAVGGAVSEGQGGPMIGYCYGVIVDSLRQKVTKVLSTVELQSEFPSARCRASP